MELWIGVVDFAYIAICLLFHFAFVLIHIHSWDIFSTQPQEVNPTLMMHPNFYNLVGVRPLLVSKGSWKSPGIFHNLQFQSIDYMSIHEDFML